MAKYLALLSCIYIFLSCHHGKPDYTSLIKGDWQAQKTTEGFEHDQTEFLSFEDSTCHAGIVTGPLKYKIANDTLYFTDAYDGMGKFKIITLTKDSLMLLSGKHQRDTLSYSKVRIKNNLTPTAVYFTNSRCHACSILVLEIDSSRTFRFFGSTFTSLGANKGKLSERVYQSILNKIRALPLDTLKNNYPSPDKKKILTQISIVHKNGIARFAANGHENEPVELHILLEKLKYLAYEKNYALDSSLKATYFNANPIITSMIGEILPPPPPPLPVDSLMQQFVAPQVGN